MADNAALVEHAARKPLTLPVLALGGDTVGSALQRQLEPITADLRGEIIPDCGHIIPADAPGPLAAQLSAFLEGSSTSHADAGRSCHSGVHAR
ncbi:MAG: alpha/beta hydrolase [Actinomycetota bacterium]|nr:alpha/beta hydrolase [Actinomycetota bacterium]